MRNLYHTVAYHFTARVWVYSALAVFLAMFARAYEIGIAS